jgi:hypothetical protein
MGGLGAPGEARLNVDVNSAPLCDAGDDQVAWWHTHPPIWIEAWKGKEGYYANASGLSGEYGEDGDKGFVGNSRKNPRGLPVWVTVYNRDGIWSERTK